MKVLVTAFKPFHKSTNNYSMEVLYYLNNVEKLVIDVCYDECYKEITKKFNLEEFDLIIALGEARSRTELTLELAAKNLASCSIKDNAGILKKDELIVNENIEALHTLVETSCVDDLVKFSLDAGKYVCNNLYFHLLYNYPNKSLFIHIPECNNDSNEYIKYAKVIEEIIKRIGDKI